MGSSCTFPCPGVPNLRTPSPKSTGIIRSAITIPILVVLDNNDCGIQNGDASIFSTRLRQLIRELRLVYPLTEPAVRPATMNRCATMYRMATGIAVMIEAAKS